MFGSIFVLVVNFPAGSFLEMGFCLFLMFLFFRCLPDDLLGGERNGLGRREKRPKKIVRWEKGSKKKTGRWENSHKKGGRRMFFKKM